MLQQRSWSGLLKRKRHATSRAAAAPAVLSSMYERCSAQLTMKWSQTDTRRIFDFALKRLKSYPSCFFECYFACRELLVGLEQQNWIYKIRHHEDIPIAWCTLGFAAGAVVWIQLDRATSMLEDSNAAPGLISSRLRQDLSVIAGVHDVAPSRDKRLRRRKF